MLHYHAVFNPSVAPFKRNASFDRVLPSETLAVGTAEGRPAPEGAAPPDREVELFWGSLALQIGPGARSPLPSVAPNMRIVRMRTTPAIGLIIERDSADNYWASSPEGFEGTVRLVMLCAAPTSYFGGPVVPFGAAQIPERLRPRVPRAIRRRAKRVLTQAGVADGDPLHAVLFRLVHYFRSFEAGSAPPPGPEGSLYLDLALAQRGVCRHRAQAFVVTARSVGLPARYVHNEAHAFAEVYLPGSGWRRVDLGGASDGLTVHNGLGKIPHVPRARDPFPRPNPYLQSYSRQARADDDPGGGAASGSSEPKEGEAPGGSKSARRSPGARRAGETGPDGAEEQPAGHAERPAAAPRSAQHPDGEPLVVASEDAPEGDGPPAAAGAPLLPPGPLRVDLSAASPGTKELRAFRGERVRLAGTVRDEGGRPVAGAPVAVVLRLRRGGPVLRVLGLLVSGSDGGFGGGVPVPAEIEAGRYEVDAVDARGLNLQ